MDYQVYFIEDVSTHTIKIGHTGNLARRFANLRTSNTHLRYIDSIHTRYHKSLEATLGRVFNSKRVDTSEFYQISMNDVELIISLWRGMDLMVISDIEKIKRLVDRLCFCFSLRSPTIKLYHNEVSCLSLGSLKSIFGFTFTDSEIPYEFPSGISHKVKYFEKVKYLSFHPGHVKIHDLIESLWLICGKNLLDAKAVIEIYQLPENVLETKEKIVEDYFEKLVHLWRRNEMVFKLESSRLVKDEDKYNCHIEADWFFLPIDEKIVSLNLMLEKAKGYENELFSTVTTRRLLLKGTYTFKNFSRYMGMLLETTSKIVLSRKDGSDLFSSVLHRQDYIAVGRLNEGKIVNLDEISTKICKHNKIDVLTIDYIHEREKTLRKENELLSLLKTLEPPKKRDTLEYLYDSFDDEIFLDY